MTTGELGEFVVELNAKDGSYLQIKASQLWNNTSEFYCAVVVRFAHEICPVVVASSTCLDVALEELRDKWREKHEE